MTQGAGGGSGSDGGDGGGNEAGFLIGIQGLIAGEQGSFTWKEKTRVNITFERTTK